jgi:hypothetical protein
VSKSPLLANLRPINSSEPGSFANKVITERHPAIIRQVMDDRPCEEVQADGLEALLEESFSGSINPLRDGAHDSAYWQSSGQAYLGAAWTDAPFLWAESFFYRRLLECLTFFEPGPWHRIDPFQVMKDRELTGDAVEAFLQEITALNDMSDRDAFRALLQAALLGNRADLGFRMGGSAGFMPGVELIDDQTESIWDYLTSTAQPRIVLVADNAGLEILSDLLLCDFLIHRLGCSDIALHLKPTPYYVSDATTADVLTAVRRLRRGAAKAQDAWARIMVDVRTSRLRLAAHDFNCRPECYWSLPPELSAEFERADLVVAKGDLNYRRLVGDAECDPTISFQEACAYFPAPVAALRILKSDVAVGLQRAVVTRLEATGKPWRTDGTCGVIQCRLPAPGTSTTA